METNWMLKMTFAKLGALIVILTDLYHFYKSINNNKIWIIAAVFPIDINKKYLDQTPKYILLLTSGHW